MQMLTTPWKVTPPIIPENIFSITETTLHSGARLLTSLNCDTTNEIVSSFEKTGKGRLHKNPDGCIELLDSLWLEYGDTHTDLHDINELIRIKERILSLYKTKDFNETFTIVDWGCGAGHTLMQLDKWLQKEGITGVNLYGYANEIHPDWQYAPNNITFIFDVADNLPNYFDERSVDLIYSIAGLYYLFLPLDDGHDLDMIEYFQKHRFNGRLFQNYSHTEEHLEQLSYIMEPHGELLIDLPIHVIEIDYTLLKPQSSNYSTIRNSQKFGEHAYVVVPTLSYNHEPMLTTMN